MTAQNTLIPKPANLSAAKRRILENRLHGLSTQSPPPEILEHPAGPAPLSFAQRRLWFMDQLNPGSPVYNMPLAMRLHGLLQPELLRRAFAAVVARHEILRTTFSHEEGCPRQTVRPFDTFAMPLVEVSVADKSGLTDLLRTEARVPFDLSRDLLLRAKLFRCSPTDHVLFLNMHHIASDAWSFAIMFREVGEVYTALCEERLPNLQRLPFQYSDYAWTQQKRAAEGALQTHLEYWKAQLTGAPFLLELPTDRSRPPLPTFRGGRQARQLSAKASALLKTTAQEHGATLFMTLLSAWQIFLHRITRQEDILVGTPVSGRDQVEIEYLIGFFVNNLVLRSRLTADLSFAEFLSLTRKTTLDAHAHQDLPFERLVEVLCPDRSVSDSPLIQSMFVLQPNAAAALKLPELDAALVEVDNGTAKFDLTMGVTESADGLTAELEYNLDVLDDSTAARWLTHFDTLLNAILENPKIRLSQIPLLTPADQERMIVQWNHTAVDFPRASTVSQVFEKVASERSSTLAIVHGEHQLTYGELNQRANQLASYLQRYGVTPGQCVGVYLERSPALIVALLAILKVGCAYLPLDRSYPKERIAFMLADSQAPVVITEQKLVNGLPEDPGQLLCLDTQARLIALEHAADRVPLGDGESLAYLIYTSGSTGKPKGVCVPHRAILRLVINPDYAPLGPSDVVAQASNCSFDAATWEIWGALLNGARLVIVPTELLLSPREFGSELRRQSVSALFLTTALFNELACECPGAFANLKHLLFGGEAVEPRWVREVLRNGKPQRLVHVYGPTETTTFATWHLVERVPDQARTVPIGKPIANTTAYILDPWLQPVPTGIPGELYIGGEGVAHGYLQRPELTAGRFVPDNFLPQRGRRMYRTGDLVRSLPNGEIEYVGRIDQQVKIRGFRVELGEIEARLQEHSTVGQCVVTVRPDATGTRQLVAYVTSQPGMTVNVTECQKHLRQHLPEYMVPPYVLVIPEIPLTPNGKVDLNALATPELGSHSAECVAPRDSVERQLQSIWEQALQRVGVGVRDKFFAVGGHSLLALRVLAQVEKVFGTRLSVTTFFQSPTIEQLARLLRAPQAAGVEKDLVEIQVGGSKPPLILVHGVGGGMLWGYGNLAKRLGADQPVLAFKSRGLEGRDEHHTIEAMAADYVQQLRTALPHGPYYLGGYCFGGVVAYEMARQLKAQGESIALLALINSSPPNSSYARVSVTPAYAWKFITNFCHWAANSLNWTPEQRRGFFQWKARLLRRRFQRLVRGGQSVRIEVDELIDLAQLPEDQRRIWEAHVRALVLYHPKPYNGHVTLFRSPVHHLVCSFDPAYGWGEFAQGGITVRIVAGAHEKVIEEPHVETLAAEINAALEKVQKWVSSSPGQPNGKSHDHVDRHLSGNTKAVPISLGF